MCDCGVSFCLNVDPDKFALCLEGTAVVSAKTARRLLCPDLDPNMSTHYTDGRKSGIYMYLHDLPCS